MGSELDDDLGDFDAGGSTNSDNDKVDSILIKKILSEMKSEFNRGVCQIPYRIKDESEDQLSSANLSASLDTSFPPENGHTSESENNKNDSKASPEPEQDLVTPLPEESLQSNDYVEEPTEENRENNANEEEFDSVNTFDSISEKNLEILDPPKKKTKVNKESQKNKASPEPQASEETNTVADRKSRRSLRIVDKPDQEVSVKRSSRRMSKEYSRESVLQNAIARKEKSFSSLNSSEEKHRRSSRLSEDKTTSKARTATRTSLKGSNDDLSSLKGSSVNGKAKSPNLTNSEVNDTENDSLDITVSSTPKKDLKAQVENGFDEDLSNNILNNHQSENEWEKGTDSSSNFSASSCKAKKKTFSFVNESYQPPAKKAKPDSSVETNEAPSRDESLPPMAWTKGSCECQVNQGLYPSKASLASVSYCRALDSFENRVIGCCNPVSENSPLLRPSQTVPLLLMCTLHIGRLVRHNCCPTCGLFCTQGFFYQCKEKHFFHKDCELKKDELLLCPHCASEDFIEVKLSLGPHQYPVFLPMQRLPNKFPLARMSINRGSYRDLEKKDESEINELVPQKELLLNNRKFSSEGLPAVEKEKLETLMHAFASRNDLPQRYSSRAFYQACKHGDAEKVLSMIGGNIKESCSMMALHAAAGNGHLLVVHILVQSGLALEALDKSQYTPLMLAAVNRHNSVVKYLVKAGANVAFKGSDGMTALHLAAKVGNLEACHYLLSAANTPLTYVDSIDDGRWTPLVWAAENRHADVVRYLLEKKADPQIRDSEMNIALHWSAYSGSMEITEDLLNYGSSINLSNAHGDTPLHIAARQGADDCVMLLLARGAQTDVANKAGQLPADCVLADFTYCKAAIELNMKIKCAIKKPLSFPKILSNDISRGHEQNPIQVVNNVDDDPTPSDFTYITENCVTSNLSIDRRITSLTGCKCEDTCTTGSCMCSRISLRCWYDSRGKLLPEFNFEDPPMIFECNQTCECNALSCKNRVVQRGLKVKLQVCKTKSKNWGVITLREIPKGTYVCEYIGEIISDCEADTREDDSYLFDLDNRDGESYCIDACKYGNVTRFVNHSCKPNLVPVRIFVGHHDLHFPRIAFFAARDIAPNEELGFDYGEKFWVIKYKNFTCSCEELNCRYSSDTIYDTLEKYKEKLKLEESL